MKTRTTCPAVLVAVLLVGGFLSPVQAEDSAPAYGQTNATLGCDKTVDGYKVSVLDQVFRNEFRAENGIDIALGDPCLSSLVEFPPPFPSLLAVTDLNPTADYVNVFERHCIIWILDGANGITGFGTFAVKPRQVVACDVDAGGGLVTTLVDTAEGPDPSYIGNRCGSTLGALTVQGARSSSPITGVLGFDDMNTPVGGLMWVMTKPDDIKLLECNLNAAEDQLLVTYSENVDGVDATAVGEPCLARIAESEAAGHRITSGPIPLPQAQTSEPGCLLWEIAGGIVHETK